MLEIRPTRGASADIHALAWWQRNREKAPRALAEELDRALTLIATSPFVGVRSSSAKSRAVRKLMLPRVRYWLYYRIVDSPQTHVELLALWHASRSARFVREPAVAYTVPTARAA